MDSRIEMWQVSNNISAHPIITRTVAAVLDWARVWSPSDSDSCWYQLKSNQIIPPFHQSHHPVTGPHLEKFKLLLASCSVDSIFLLHKMYVLSAVVQRCVTRVEVLCEGIFGVDG